MRSLKKVKFIQDRCVYKIDARLKSGGWEALRQTLHTPTTDNFKFDENVRKFTQMDRKYVGKGEIARYEQLLLSQCFQKT